MITVIDDYGDLLKTMRRSIPIIPSHPSMAGSDFGVRAATGAVSASGTLWEMIRQSGTGTGDAVRDVSEVLLDCAASFGFPERNTQALYGDQRGNWSHVGKPIIVDNGFMALAGYSILPL